MKDDHKLSKVKPTVDGKKQQLKTLISEREEEIQFLVDEFRRTFHTSQQYEMAFADIDPDDYYDAIVDRSMEEYAGVGGDDDIEDFRAAFQMLGAEDKFNQCCIDYYQDVLAETKTHIANDKKLLSVLRAEMSDESVVLDKKTKRSNLNEQARLEERIELNSAEQVRTEQKLQKLLKSNQTTIEDAKNKD